METFLMCHVFFFGVWHVDSVIFKYIAHFGRSYYVAIIIGPILSYTDCIKSIFSIAYCQQSNTGEYFIIEGSYIMILFWLLLLFAHLPSSSAQLKYEETAVSPHSPLIFLSNSSKWMVETNIMVLKPAQGPHMFPLKYYSPFSFPSWRNMLVISENLHMQDNAE